jgi:ATP-dependent Clp protease ATP-binding subunit ClpA
MASDLALRLAEHGMQLEFDEEVYHWLVQRCCTDRRYGARPLRRGIQRYIEDVISEKLIVEGKPIEEKVLRISRRGEELLFESEEEPFTAPVT